MPYKIWPHIHIKYNENWFTLWAVEHLQKTTNIQNSKNVRVQ